MPEKSGYAPGTPSWVDLSSTDMAASKAFYTGLFGWEAAVAEDPAAGGYTMFLKDGKNVAGVGPVFAEGQHPAWSTYVTTEDADATAAAVTAAGGKVFLEPMDVLQAGRMAVFQDPTGAFVSVWQPRDHRGAQLVNEPGAFTWNELATRDTQAAKDFYAKTFGWTSEDTEMQGMTYTTFKLADAPIGGMLQMGDNFPPEVPPHWLVYFAVDDADRAVATAEKLGGTAMMQPMDIPGMGRFAPIRDPQGAVFAVFQAAPPQS